MIGEKSINPDWYATGESPGDDQGPYVGDNRDNMRWGDWTHAAADTLLPAQDRVGTDDSFRFGSAHAGGFNMALCDGSVRSIGYNIDELIHRRLCNRKNGQPLDQNGF